MTYHIMYLLKYREKMKEFEKYYNNKRLPQNLRFQIYAKKGKKVADTETLFA